MAHLQPYEYKSVNEVWVSNIPAHWEIKRLGSLLEERNEMNADRQVQQVLSLVRKRGVMRYEDKGRLGNKRSEDVARYKVVREGDIVLNSMNVIIGSVGQSAYTGCLSPVYYVLKPRSSEHINAYFNAIFQVERFHSSLVRFGKGILAHRLRIPMIDLKTVMLPVPPPDEMELIVRFLAHTDLRISKAIANKQRMIALLEEREELALLQAITQSDQPMRTDSRLDWLGEFPAHWEIKRLGSLLEERNEMNADRQVQQVLSLVRKRGVMRYEDKGRLGNKRSEDVARYKVVREGDIVLNSMNVIIGSVGQSAYTGCLSPVYYVLKPRSSEHINAYFNAIFQVERFHSSLVRFGKGILAHRLRIPMIDLKTVMLPVPPPDEQLAIVDRVVRATAELKTAKASIASEIALLKEYRMRLISDVVTGKLDVREEAAKLSEIDPMELTTVVVGENGDDEEVADDD